MHLIFFFESIHLNSSKFIFKKLLKKEEEEEEEESIVTRIIGEFEEWRASLNRLFPR